MTYSSVIRRATRFRACLLVALAAGFVACDASEQLTSSSPEDPAVQTTDPSSNPAEPSFATSFAGGIAFGTFGLPTGWFGGTYNGGLRNIWPAYLRRELAAIKSRGGKVVLALAGHERYYKDSNGNFSFTKWKKRIDRFRGVNFSSYISDGTVIAHYLIDEPNDPHNWGRPIPGTTLEAMAKYSKQIWPGMATVVRVDATYLTKWTGYRYLDAAWAQYVRRKGTPGDYLRANIRAAQNRGLALVTGMNLLRGGYRGSKMTASQVRSWGATLLSFSHPCAFISWNYNSTYLSSRGIRDAMRYLRSRAQNRSLKSCRS